MAIVKMMSSKATVGKIERYVKDLEKAEERHISGLNCNHEEFSKECKATNLLYDKNKSAGERKYYHVVQSFSPKDNVTPEKAHVIARDFAEKHFNKHEVLIATHKDKEHIHNHFVVNSVSFENGKKYHSDNKNLWDMKRHSNELCREYNLEHSIQDLEKKSKNRIMSGELRKIVRGDDVWKMDLKAQIEAELEKAKSIEDFKKKMLEKHKVEVRERIRTSKGEKQKVYEYKPEGNRKFCSEKRLGTDYGKERIDGIIERREQRTRGQAKAYKESREHERIRTEPRKDKSGRAKELSQDKHKDGRDEISKSPADGIVGAIQSAVREVADRVKQATETTEERDSRIKRDSDKSKEQQREPESGRKRDRGGHSR